MSNHFPAALPTSKVLYASQKGGKPLVIGMNRAKRVSRLMDERDRRAVVEIMGPGMPKQHKHASRLVAQRHAAIIDRENAYDEARRVREAAPVAGDPSGSDPPAGDDVGAVPDAAPGPADQ